MYGATEASYDGLTRRKGAFRLFEKGLHAGHEAELPLSLSMIVTRHNGHEVPQMRALSERLMAVISLLSETGVPRVLLHAAGQAGLLQPAGHDAVAPAEVDAALGRLGGASLLTFSLDHSAVIAHRLTMRVVREQMAADGDLPKRAPEIADLLLAVTGSLDEPWQNRAAARATVQQIAALHDHVNPYLGEHDSELAGSLLRLRHWATWCLNKLGDSFSQSIGLGLDVVADRERVLGESHPDTLVSRNNLAYAYAYAGRLGEAIPLFERTLADSERVLGESHPDTLTSRNNLAAAYRDARRRASAPNTIPRGSV